MPHTAASSADDGSPCRGGAVAVSSTPSRDVGVSDGKARRPRSRRVDGVFRFSVDAGGTRCWGAQACRLVAGPAFERGIKSAL
jgi:hypothetical protein